MTDLVISCLSQKGGVGKSTIARLVATSYARHRQKTAIFDFNGAQETSLFWASLRNSAGIDPPIHVELATQANRMQADRRFNVIVADGRPDSPEITLSIAKASNLVVVPTGFTVDDLVPQRRFALELSELGIPRNRILFVINRVLDYDDLTQDAISYLEGFSVAKSVLPYRKSYIRCHMAGYSVGEVREAVQGNMTGLHDAANNLATEIAEHALESIF
jgi:chromosome partitioning protein